MLNEVQREYRYIRFPKMAAVVITVLPILLVYPFILKYFAKGAMIGAVKG